MSPLAGQNGDPNAQPGNRTVYLGVSDNYLAQFRDLTRTLR